MIKTVITALAAHRKTVLDLQTSQAQKWRHHAVTMHTNKKAAHTHTHTHTSKQLVRQHSENSSANESRQDLAYDLSCLLLLKSDLSCNH